MAVLSRSDLLLLKLDALTFMPWLLLCEKCDPEVFSGGIVGTRCRELCGCCCCWRCMAVKSPVIVAAEKVDGGTGTMDWVVINRPVYGVKRCLGKQFIFCSDFWRIIG